MVVATDALNAELIETSETLTAVRSKMSMNSAITKTDATIHLYGTFVSGFWITTPLLITGSRRETRPVVVDASATAAFEAAGVDRLILLPNPKADRDGLLRLVEQTRELAQG